jgi:hypothetical protein
VPDEGAESFAADVMLDALRIGMSHTGGNAERSQELHDNLVPVP